MLQDKNIQDKLSTTGWARDWVWSVAYVMVQKFGANPNVQLIPPSVEAWSQQWHTYRGNLADTLTELLPKLTFHEIYEEWQWKMVENHHQSQQEWGTNMDFCWKFMRPKVSIIETLLCLFSSTNMVPMSMNIWDSRIKTLINCSSGNDRFNKDF